MKTHPETEIRKLFKQQNYKYASLKSTDGKSIVTYNTENNPKVKASHKVDEAFDRLKVLPDGVYMFCFANSKGRNVQPDEFAYMKGNVAVDENGKGYPFQVMNNLPATKPSEYEKILSYPEVMKLQLQLTTTEFKLQATEAELSKANAEIVSLNAEIQALEAKGLSEDNPNSPTRWVEMLGANLLPVVDKYFNLQDKKIALAARQQNMQMRSKQNPQQQRSEFPPIGSPQFEKWLDMLEQANEEDYEKTMAYVKEKSPKHYDAIIAELEGEEEDQQN